MEGGLTPVCPALTQLFCPLFFLFFLQIRREKLLDVEAGRGAGETTRRRSTRLGWVDPTQPNPTQVESAGLGDVVQLGDAVQLVERFGDVEGRREEFRRGTSVLARGCGEERRRDVAFMLSRDTTQKSGERGSS